MTWDSAAADRTTAAAISEGLNCRSFVAADQMHTYIYLEACSNHIVTIAYRMEKAGKYDSLMHEVIWCTFNTAKYDIGAPRNESAT
jgi:hypothetical protein